MRLLRLPELLLSLLLQVAPILRVASADAALALSPVMAVLRLLAGAGAVAGSFHAVSGATVPTLASTKTKVGAIGINLNYRILLSGGSPEAYEATPLAEGLTLIGSEIKGLPTVPGETLTTISAWDNPDFSGHQMSGEVTFLVVALGPLAPSVPAGSPVTWQVTGPATAKVAYRWLRDAVEIPGATNSSFTLPSVTESDAGLYRARVTFGNTFVLTQQATLTVTPPANGPTFTATPVDVTLHLGEPLLLHSAATGAGDLTFAWTRNGNPVTGATAADLAVEAITLEDAGSYQVTVTGSGGSATSSPAIVTVASPLAVGTVSLNEANLLVPFNGIVGRTYVLENQPAFGSLEWQDAAELVAGEASTFSLPITDFDAGMFRVRTK